MRLAVSHYENKGLLIELNSLEATFGSTWKVSTLLCPYCRIHKEASNRTPCSLIKFFSLLYMPPPEVLCSSVLENLKAACFLADDVSVFHLIDHPSYRENKYCLIIFTLLKRDAFGQ